MKRDLDIERDAPRRQTSTLTKRLAHRPETEASPRPEPPARPKAPARPEPTSRPQPPARPEPQPKPDGDGAGDGDGTPAPHAPDVAENEGVSPVQKPPRGASKSRSRNRRHGRRR
jgi:pyruvate dehydrogenase E2 component (dihydrolipoamide acetyltransferase)